MASVAIKEIGNEKGRVVVIDDFMANAGQVVDIAASLAPFPQVANHYYPGQRRIVMPEEPAFQYIDYVCHQIAPLLRQAYGVERFRITEAGFSMVTQAPQDIQMIQRVPHFDTFNPKDFAILHYLSQPEKGGTGFYRHKRTGFEIMTEARHPAFREALDEDVRAYGEPEVAYISGSTPAFERIAHFDGHFNRMLIYQGALLHSGQIPDGFDFDPDPRKGRLTGNIFLQAT